MAILAAMVVLLLWLSTLAAGGAGVVWAAVASVFAVGFGRRVPVQVLLRWWGARHLPEREAPRLYAVLRQLAQRANLSHSPPQLYMLPTRRLNALTLGQGSQTAIVVSEGLLRTLDTREIAGVLAHELGHVMHRDTQLMRLAALTSGLTRWLARIALLAFVLGWPLSASAAARPLFWVLALVVLPLTSDLLLLALSRSREFDADRSAVDLTRDPIGLAAALDRMERGADTWWRRMLDPRRSPGPSWLQTHPATRHRIRKLLALEAAAA